MINGIAGMKFIGARDTIKTIVFTEGEVRCKQHVRKRVASKTLFDAGKGVVKYR